MRLSKSNQEIRTLEEWRTIASPKGKDAHWVDGHSAKEFARAWCDTGSALVPDAISEVMRSHPDFDSVEFVSGEPEARVPFDDLAGEPRNADLVILARDAKGPIGISIEAKADEPFGEYVGDAWATACERLLSNPASGGVMRIESLISSLLPERGEIRPKLPRLHDVRYQLLTATAGALAWAKTCSAGRAVLLVHEFATALTKAELRQRNAKDLDRFVQRMSGGKYPGSEHGRLIGPIQVGGRPLFERPPALYIGKVTTGRGT